MDKKKMISLDTVFLDAKKKNFSIMTNIGNNENNNENNEDRMSYRELKELHDMSMTTLNNMSKIIPSLLSSTTTSSSLITSKNLYSSINVKISKMNNNWLIPYHPYKESCRLCKYFGHSLKNCPNIRSEFRGDYCIHCWETGHNSGNCNKEAKVVPFNEEFSRQRRL